MDPTNLFAITYTLLFGIMFGDLGQGLLLVLAGLALAKWKKMNFGRIGIRLGVSSMIFGALYGSVFGFEELLDPLYEAMGISFLPIKVFDNAMTNWLLIGAIVIGVVLICVSIGINIIVGLRQRDYQRAVFGHNGFAGLIFYLAAAFMVVNMMALNTDICGPLYVIFLIVLPLLLIFFSGPLSKLAARRKARPDQKIGEFIIENFFESSSIRRLYPEPRRNDDGGDVPGRNGRGSLQCRRGCRLRAGGGAGQPVRHGAGGPDCGHPVSAAGILRDVQPQL